MNTPSSQTPEDVTRVRLIYPPVHRFSFSAKLLETPPEGTLFQRVASWHWCRVDELAQFIRNEFGHNWTPAELLKRYALPKEQGEVRMYPQAPSCRPDDVLMVWWYQSMRPYVAPYCLADERRTWNGLSAFVPVGWVDDILYACKQGWTRVELDPKSRLKMGCTEDGKAVWPLGRDPTLGL